MKSLLMRLSGVVVVLSVLLTSCSSDPEEKIIPNFPTIVEHTVEAGDVVEIAIEPNTKWEVSIPVELATWFYLQDGSQKAYTMRGDAGATTIKVGVADIEEFDQNRVCDVTMSMNGEQQVIATLTRYAQQRAISIYLSQVNEQNQLIYKDGSYLYESTPSDSIDLVWDIDEYIRPVKVVANFEWAVKSYPTWIDVASVGEVSEDGVMIIRGNPAEYPVDVDGEGRISFVDKNSSGDWLHDMPATIPACGDIFECKVSSMLRFNLAGEYQSSSDTDEALATGSIYSVDGTALYAVTYADGAYSVTLGADAWVKPTLAEWNSAESSKIQIRQFEVTVTANEAAPREAMLLALPYNVAKQITDPATQLVSDSGKSLREGMSAYIVSRIYQEGITSGEDNADWGAIEPVNSLQTMAEAGASFKVISADDKRQSLASWLSGELNIMGVGNCIYQMIYNNLTTAAAASPIAINTPFASYKILDDMNLAETDKPYVKLTQQGENYIIEMEDNGYGSFYERCIVFYDENELAYAAVWCTFDPYAEIYAADPVWGVVAPVNSALAMAEAGAKFETVAIDSDLGEMFSSEFYLQEGEMFRLTYNNADAVEAAILKILAAYSQARWYEPKGSRLTLLTKTEKMELREVTGGNAIYMTPTEDGSAYERCLILVDSNLIAWVGIWCVYDPAAEM